MIDYSPTEFPSVTRSFAIWHTCAIFTVLQHDGDLKLSWWWRRKTAEGTPQQFTASASCLGLFIYPNADSIPYNLWVMTTFDGLTVKTEGSLNWAIKIFVVCCRRFKIRSIIILFMFFRGLKKLKSSPRRGIRTVKIN